MAPIVSRIIFALSALVVVLAIACAWLYSSDDSNTLPIDRVLNAEQIAKAPENAAGPLVVQLGHNEFALVNTTRFPIHYRGYPSRAMAYGPPRGVINPFYQRQFRAEEGPWQSNGPGWCGTGSETLTVPPGRAGRFGAHSGVDLPPDRQGPWGRIGVVYWTSDPARAQTVWSEPIRQ
jgi:hypothetical protein